MVRLGSLDGVEAPTEDAAKIAELEGGRKLEASVTLDTIPSLVA
jgi:hypothetical protein